MKKLLFSMLAITLAAPALAAQQPVAQLSSVTASREALRVAVNTQLSAVQANFDEVYAVIDAGPVYVNASAPADTKVIWVDTDQSNAIKVYVGGAWAVVGSGGIAGDDLGSAAYSDVVALWTTCTGYLKSDGTCDTPSGSATYPSAAGVANWNGSAWGTSYTVGTAANNLVQLNASAQLPAVSADLLTITDIGTYFTTDTVGAALNQLGSELAEVTQITLDASLTVAAGVLSVTHPVTNYDTDSDGDFTDETWFPAAGIGGSTGSADNAVLRANGTGGSTAQASGVTIDDNDNIATTGTISGKMVSVVNSDTASYAVTAAQARANTLFLTTNAATTTYILPPAEAGMMACFVMGQGNKKILGIDTDGTDFIVKFSDRARTTLAGNYYQATASAKNKVCVAAYDETDWYVENEVGTWTEE